MPPARTRCHWQGKGWGGEVPDSLGHIPVPFYHGTLFVFFVAAICKALYIYLLTCLSFACLPHWKRSSERMGALSVLFPVPGNP